jgi:hypothetical protein
MTYNYQEEAKKRQLSEAKATLRKTLAGDSSEDIREAGLQILGDEPE